MRVSDITEKTVDFFKKNGRIIISTLALGTALVVPAEDAIAEKKQRNDNIPQTKNNLTINYDNSISDEELIRQSIKDNKIVLVADGKRTVLDENEAGKYVEKISEYAKERVVGHRDQDDIYIVRTEWKKSKDYSKSRREYYRVVMRISPNESFDPVYFSRKWENLIKELKEHPEKISHMFDVLETSQEKIVLNKAMEARFDTQVISLTVEGRDFTVYYPAANNNTATTLYMVLIITIGMSFGLAGALAAIPRK